MPRRRTFKPEFKARVVLEDLTSVKSATEICREHSLSSQVLARSLSFWSGRPRSLPYQDAGATSQNESPNWSVWSGG